MANAGDQIPVTAIGVSPTFVVTGEEFRLDYFQSLSPVDWDMVKPPWWGENGGGSTAMNYYNQWFPWADEKLVEPKYDGVCEFLGTPSNAPTHIKDYHFIALFRAIDYILQPRYEAVIRANVDTPAPQPPPTA